MIGLRCRMMLRFCNIEERGHFLAISCGGAPLSRLYSYLNGTFCHFFFSCLGRVFTVLVPGMV